MRLPFGISGARPTRAVRWHRASAGHVRCGRAGAGGTLWSSCSGRHRRPCVFDHSSPGSPYEPRASSSSTEGRVGVHPSRALARLAETREFRANSPPAP